MVKSPHLFRRSWRLHSEGDPHPRGKHARPQRAAILRAIVYSHWSLDSQKPGEVDAHLARGGWDMAVAIDYGQQITIHYVSSDNLDYDPSSDPPSIHHGYNVRVKRLMDEIAREVILADASAD